MFCYIITVSELIQLLLYMLENKTELDKYKQTKYVK